ncbi:ABC transporter permease [Psychromonas sp. RZ22]|uniref:ABC transporter permease n=1 Tax=Psychromonas algarum TaxID=2555643 RepID=UPI001067BA9C|nr:ABC transporter permease [Psychromonas sp. RZ22]TEW55769.1 ABC transporter permease [Psychromonas sp. RZ22]
MAILLLAFKSLLNRKLTVFITLFSIAISVTLLLGVQTLKTETNNSFMKSISGTDLIIGSRGASSQLLLSSVFHIGNTSNTIQYKTYQELAKSPAVKWAVPISMGDSHHGYTVLATDLNFFTHFSYANKQHLKVQSGKIDDDMFAVVIGAEVAKKLHYHIGDKVIVTHGDGKIEGHHHDNIPFYVSAILAPSFTAIDQTLIISLEAMEAMHADHHGHIGALPGEKTLPVNNKKHMHKIASKDADHEYEAHSSHEHHAQHDDHEHDHEAHSNHEHHEHDHEAHSSHEHHEHDHEAHSNHEHHEHDHDHEAHSNHEHHEHDHDHEAHSSHEHHDTQEQRIARLLKLKPDNINAIFVGLNSPQAILGMQNYVNNFQAEPLTAIIPAVALQELWQFFNIAEVALDIVTVFVVLVGLLGMLSIILMSLNERRREMAILRSVGARPMHIFALIIGEAGFICFIGILLGTLLLYLLQYVLQAPLASYYGFYLEINMLTLNDLFILLIIQISALLIALIPASLIYKYSLSDGMSIKF